MSIPDIKTALLQLAEEGVTHLAVLPTFLLPGVEFDLLLKTVDEHRSLFSSVQMSPPLLFEEADRKALLFILLDALSPAPADALLLMGHGTEHAANDLYHAMNDMLQEKGIFNCFFTTVEGTPNFADALLWAKERRPERVLLAPFLLVAGDHATNDLCGDEDDSLKCLLEKEGLAPVCSLKGLGEYSRVRRLLLSHLSDALAAL